MLLDKQNDRFPRCLHLGPAWPPAPIAAENRVYLPIAFAPSTTAVLPTPAIAATTWSEYRQYIEKDPALTRRFQPIQVDEPDVARCCDMLRGILGPMEKHHKVRVPMPRLLRRSRRRAATSRRASFPTDAPRELYCR